MNFNIRLIKLLRIDDYNILFFIVESDSDSQLIYRFSQSGARLILIGRELIGNDIVPDWTTAISQLRALRMDI